MLDMKASRIPVTGAVSFGQMLQSTASRLGMSGDPRELAVQFDTLSLIRGG